MPDSNNRKVPVGKRKGGTRFPRIPLAKAIDYSKRLVAKTHVAAQPATIILAGVFDNSGSTGETRVSAVKQYGLLQGTSDAYEATKLAKEIESAPPDEAEELLRRACLNSAVFKTLYETFQGDKVHPSKIRQQSLNLGVHPELGEECAQIFVDSLITANLARKVEDQIEIIRTGKASNGKEDEDSNHNPSEQGEEVINDPPDTKPEGNNKVDAGDHDANRRVVPPPSGGISNAAVQVHLDVDSHTDTDKLEKQLKLLRNFGVI